MKSNVYYRPYFQRHRVSGIIRVRIHTMRGAQWLSTGQTNFKAAHEVCDKAKIAELQMAACAGALSHSVVSRLLTGRSFDCAAIFQAWREEAFLDLAADTFNGYEMTLRHWMEFCECAKSPLSAIKRFALDAFVNEPGVGAGTRKGRLASLRSFYRFAANAGYCVGNPAERVRLKTADLLFCQLAPKETIPLTEDEFRLLVASPRVKPFWRYALALGWHAGMRIKDIACLEVASISPDSLTIYPHKTRRNGQRVQVPIDDPLFGGGELRQILTEIIAQTPPGSKFCFPARREMAMDPKRRACLSYSVVKVLKQHGIAGKRHHSCRHAHAMRLKKAGLTIEGIAARLGHANTSMTEHYLDHED